MKKIIAFCFLFLILKNHAQCPWNFTVSSTSGSFSITCTNPNPINLQTVNSNSNAVSYFWSGPSFTSAATNVVVSQAGTYTVIATDAVTSCSVLQIFTISINAVFPTNNVSPVSASVTCLNGSVSFTGTVIDPTLTVMHKWFSPLNPMPGGVAMVTSNNTLSILSGSFSPGEYTLVTTNIINGCIAASTFTITSPDAFPFFNISSSTNFSVGCTSGNQTTLSLINPVSTQTPQATLTYTMVAPGATIAALPWGGSTSTITSIAGTWFVCVNDNSNNCKTVLPVPILQSPFSANFSYTVNAGGLVNFVSTSTGTNIATTYNWDFGDATSGTGTSAAHTYSNGGIHNVVLNTIGPNCNIIFPINVNTVPCSANSNYTLVYSGTPQNWYAIPAYYGNVTNVLWSWGDLTYDNTLYPIHTYSAAGMHTICLTVTVSCVNSSSSCSSYSVYRSIELNQAIVTVNVLNKLPIGIKNNESENDMISLYPNPTNSIIIIKNEKQKNGTVKVFNIEGKEMETLILESNKETTIENLRAGIYFIEIKIEGVVYRKKVVVMK